MTAAPLNWIKEIQLALIDSKLIPLHGFAPSFPWEEFSEKISSSLQNEFKIILSRTEFLSGEKITSGFGSRPVSISLDVTPLNAQAFWIMGKEEIAKLTALALKPSNGTKGFTSPQFQEGFYYFLASKALSVINELKAFGDLSPKVAKLASLPQEEAFCIDVEIQNPKATLWGRLVCPFSFHQEFKAFFSTREPLPLTSMLAKKIDVPVKIEIGQTLMPLSEWERVSVGDFILLDRCTYDPNTHKGTAVLTLHQSPLLRIRIKENSLKIVDYAFYREEQNSMNQNRPQDEENPDESFDAEDNSEETSETAPEENHLWAPEDIGEINEKMISSSEIPLTLTVEVARLQINLDKLLQLSPGNVLELPIKPEQGIDLTIGGKKVAKAELIKLGEMLGVKILQIGE